MAFLSVGSNIKLTFLSLSLQFSCPSISRVSLLKQRVCLLTHIKGDFFFFFKFPFNTPTLLPSTLNFHCIFWNFHSLFPFFLFHIQFYCRNFSPCCVDCERFNPNGLNFIAHYSIGFHFFIILWFCAGLVTFFTLHVQSIQSFPVCVIVWLACEVEEFCIPIVML